MNWFADNIGTIVVLLILILVVSLIIVRMIRNHKQGKTSCGCGCEHCAMKKKCSEKDEDKN